MSTKHTKGFTHEYLPLIGYYLRVQNCTKGVTRKYFQLINNRSQAVYSSCYTSPTHKLHAKISRGTMHHTRLFVNLNVSGTIDNMKVMIGKNFGKFQKEFLGNFLTICNCLLLIIHLYNIIILKVNSNLVNFSYHF